jgi:uncharacterized membrane protein
VTVLVTFTVGLVVWIVAWAFGIKAFDAFLFTGLITVLAAGARIAAPYVSQILKGTPVTPGER